MSQTTNTAFEMPISEQIWNDKYRFIKGDEIKDQTVEETWARIAKALAAKEEHPEKWATEFYSALEGFKYLPAGRITAGAGTGRAVTLFNCFVMGTIPDSMDGIFSHLREAALTMQQGGGIGYDFSTLRPKGATVRKLDADASGPLTFMDVWDAMCRTVMSAGSRRGAMMATMRCDHPDIMDFVTVKSDPARMRMFNLSVLVTDEFMSAVENEEWFTLKHGGKIYGEISAPDLWDKIISNTYAQAEPGVIFIDRINRDNNLKYCEQIASTNPCGEQPLPPYGACLLGSINLARLVENPFTSTAGIDRFAVKKLVQTAVRMMDNVVDVSNFPLKEQKHEAKAKRRIGLGVTGLADALAMCCVRYGTEEAARKTEKWMKLIDEAAYIASVELAREKGAFPLFNADEFLQDGTHASRLPEKIKDGIREHGIRNALLTSIAPTGTISLYAGNVSSGIEPIFAYSYTRKVLEKDGSHREERVEDFAVAAYRDYWETHICEWMQDSDNGRSRPLESFKPEQHLPEYFVTAQTLKPKEHVLMQAAAQKHVDSSISKTINCPEDISFEDFKDVYKMAWDLGCKGCTTYRPNEVTGSVLSVDKPVEESGDESQTINVEPETVGMTKKEIADLEEAMTTIPKWQSPGKDDSDLPQRPETLEGRTYKIKVGDQKAVYLTVNDLIENSGEVRPFEIFLRSSDPTHDEWMVAIARTVSAIMRRPYGARFIAEEFKRIHSPTTGGFQRGGGYQPSLLAAIGCKLLEHMDDRVIVGPLILDEAPPALVTPKFMTSVRGPQCPACFGFNVVKEAGCMVCKDCGHSKCG